MINYAVVGAGWISQIAFLPGVGQSGNSRVAAIVTGDRTKSERLAQFYGIETVVGYDAYDELLTSPAIDAVYIALPNDMHADFAIRAARAGKHVLVEKPLAKTEAQALAMIEAARAACCLTFRPHSRKNGSQPQSPCLWQEPSPAFGNERPHGLHLAVIQSCPRQGRGIAHLPSQLPRRLRRRGNALNR